MQPTTLLSFTLAPLMLLAGCGRGGPSLIEIEVPASNSGEPAASVKEIERSERTSTVNVRQAEGSSVASSMILLRSFRDIARARKREYFINLDEWPGDGGSRTYVIGFTNTRDADLKKEFGDRFDYKNDAGQTRRYFSVSELESFGSRENGK